MINPRVVTPLVGVADSNRFISIDTDTTDCVDANMDDPSKAMVWYFLCTSQYIHDDVIKWKHFPRYWPFVRGIHRSPVNSPHKGQCRGALMFSLICVWIIGWVNTREAGDLRRNRAHYDVIVMWCLDSLWFTATLILLKSQVRILW